MAARVRAVNDGHGKAAVMGVGWWYIWHCAFIAGDGAVLGLASGDE